MKILSDLLCSLKTDALVREAGISKRWSYLLSKKLGIALNFRGVYPNKKFNQRVLEEKSARGVAKYALSHNLIEASLGLAAISSLVDVRQKFISTKGEEIIYKMAEGKNVVMVGHFGFSKRLKKIASHLNILELRPQEGDLPSNQAGRVIPTANILIITSSTLVNHTLEGLLKYRSKKTFTMLLGPSAPPATLFFDYGIDAVCTSLFNQPFKMIRHLKRGGHFYNGAGVKFIALVKDSKIM
jgi:uncharacterized protein (DUF4213/DUF364 family)